MKRLEQVYNAINDFLTNVINSSVSIAKILLQSSFSSTRNLPQDDKGKDCVILGNGPSLADSLIEYASNLDKYQLIAVNSFALTKEYELLKPAYYVIHDPAFWTAKHELPSKVFDAIRKKTDWSMTLYIPTKAQKNNSVNSLASDKIQIVYYNYTVYKGFRDLGFFFFKRNLAMPQSQNVLVACLYLAINNGFKNIYILGADHTWHENLAVNENNILCLKDFHFYDNGAEINLKPFRKGLDTTETHKVSEIFEIWAKVFRGYEMIASYARKTRTNIYNSSKVTFIDAFERKKLP